MATLVKKDGTIITIEHSGLVSVDINNQKEIHSCDNGQSSFVGYYYIGEDGRKQHTWDFEESIGE